MGRLALVEDEISRKLSQAHASGELRRARGFGAPLRDIPGSDETPEEFRMSFKILKDAGFGPPEIGQLCSLNSSPTLYLSLKRCFESYCIHEPT
jgi:hypothetical protein